MSGITRREQVALLLAAGTCPADNAAGVRRPVGDWNPRDLIEAYRKLDAMFRPPHPWSRPAMEARHRAWCAEHSGHDVHANWLFLPWHRGFIRLHEMALQAATSSTFRLPYWNWDERPEIPAAYTQPESPANPLWLDRSVDPISLSTAGSFGSLAEMMAPESFHVQDCNQAFGGCRDAGGPTPGSSPHRGVHVACGWPMNQMADAAGDPLFYIHHANIDRLWERWTLSRGGHAQIRYDTVWLAQDQHLTFPGALTGSQVKFGRNGDILRTERLGYTYLNVGRSGVTMPADNVQRSVPLDPRTGLAPSSEAAGRFRALARFIPRSDPRPLIFLSFQLLQPPRFAAQTYRAQLTTRRQTVPLGLLFADSVPRQVTYAFDPRYYQALLQPFRIDVAPGSGGPPRWAPISADRFRVWATYVWQ
jgi:hypothetical protein